MFVYTVGIVSFRTVVWNSKCSYLNCIAKMFYLCYSADMIITYVLLLYPLEVTLSVILLFLKIKMNFVS